MTSANKTVTTLRSTSRDGAADCSALPQPAQNRASTGAGRAHDGQGRATGAPQFEQNAAVSTISAAQVGQAGTSEL
jgi:hypothetical protein